MPCFDARRSERYRSADDITDRAIIDQTPGSLMSLSQKSVRCAANYEAVRTGQLEQIGCLFQRYRERLLAIDVLAAASARRLSS